MTLENKDKNQVSPKKGTIQCEITSEKPEDHHSEQPPMRGAILERKDQQLNKIMLAKVPCNQLCPNFSYFISTFSKNMSH